MYRAKEIDAVFIALNDVSKIPSVMHSIRELINYYKISGVDRIAVLADQNITKAYLLDPEKYFLQYINLNLIDGCNLNCKACTHFSSLYSRDEIYPLEEFERDLKQLSRKIDLSRLGLLGGEPFLLKNLDEYLEIARRCFPQTVIFIITNGLLIPTVDSKIFQAMKKHSITLQITTYKPTLQIKDKIEQRLQSEGIPGFFSDEIKIFRTYLRGEPGFSDPHKTLAICDDLKCPFLRHGKIYKCPVDILSQRYREKFPERKLPPASGVDIFAPNFLEQLDYLMNPANPIEMCESCSEHPVAVPWQPAPNPTADDWIR